MFFEDGNGAGNEPFCRPFGLANMKRQGNRKQPATPPDMLKIEEQKHGTNSTQS
jgi:hypothetical protein